MQHEMAFECRANPLCAYSATTIDSSLLRRRICLPQAVKAAAQCRTPRLESSHHHHSYDWPAACPSPLIAHRALGRCKLHRRTASRYHGHGSAHATPPRQPSIVIIFG